MKGQIAGNLQAVSILGDLLALERNRWVILYIEKIRALYVRIPVRIPGAEGIYIDGHINARSTEIIRIVHNRALHTAESAANIGDHHVPNNKLCARVRWVDFPGGFQDALLYSESWLYMLQPK
jgi:hypothetical protein